MVVVVVGVGFGLLGSWIQRARIHSQQARNDERIVAKLNEITEMTVLYESGRVVRLAGTIREADIEQLKG